MALQEDIKQKKLALLLGFNYNKKLASIETSNRYSPRTRRPRFI